LTDARQIQYLIEIFHKRSDGNNRYHYDSTPSISLTDGLAFDSDKSITSNADSFTFRVVNNKLPDGTYMYSDIYGSKIKVDDRVMIYVAGQDISGAYKTNHLIFDGLVVEINFEISGDNRILLVKGLDRFDKLFNYTFPASFKNRTASEIIQELIVHVNDDNPLNQITWYSGNTDTTVQINYNRVYRPAYEMIEELSQQAINGQFNAIYYMDTTNQFRWKQKSTGYESSLTEGQDFVTMKDAEKVWEVMNAAIMDCGKDQKGIGVHCMYYDVVSSGEYGLRWANTIQSGQEISTQLMNYYEANTPGFKPVNVTNSHLPGSYGAGLTLPLEDRDASGAKTGSYPTVTNDAQYIAAFRKEAKWQGVAKLKSLLTLVGYVRPKVDITMAGLTWKYGANRTGMSTEDCLDNSGEPLEQGDKVLIVAPSCGGTFITGFPMRVFQVSHTLSKEGWTVTIQCEIDIEDAVNYHASGR
jgi:hypothetical protein